MTNIEFLEYGLSSHSIKIKGKAVKMTQYILLKI